MIKTWDGQVILCIVVLVVLATGILVHRTLKKTRAIGSCRMVAMRSIPFDTYVINLPRATTRMQQFSTTYSASDLSATHGLIRFEGVVGKDVPIAEYVSTKALYEILRAERLRYRQKHYELTRGGVGCFLSHLNLWRSILATDKDAALIFEDDCHMARNTYDIMNHTQIPVDADIVLLGYFCNKCDPTPCGVLKVKKFFGLHAYFIRRQGIEKILANPKMKEISKQIDAVLSDMIRENQLNVYALPQPIAWQNGMPTTIQMTLRTIDGVDAWSDE